MKFKSIKLLPLITVIPLLASCSLFGGQATSTEPEITFKTIGKSNIASLVISSKISDDEHFIITSSDTDIDNAFDSTTSEGYEVIIADIGVGINAIQFESKKFKLARVIATSNQYLVSLGNDTDNVITNDDYIVGYNRNTPSTPATTSIFGVDLDTKYTTYDELITDAKTGKDGETDIDYVVMQEPYLTSLINSEGLTTTPTIVKTATEVGGYPEFGVFIADSLSNDSNRTQALLSLLSTIDKSLLDLSINGGIATISSLNKVGNSQTQITKFGIDSTSLREMQYNSSTRQNQNKLGFNSQAYDIKKFAEDHPSSDLLIPTIVDASLSPYFPK